MNTVEFKYTALNKYSVMLFKDNSQEIVVNTRSTNDAPVEVKTTSVLIPQTYTCEELQTMLKEFNGNPALLINHLKTLTS